MKTDGTIVHVVDVVSGLACGCSCPDPGCHMPLIAKKGPKNRHHFAHSSVNDAPCATGPETALHRFAQQLLSERLELGLPTLRIDDDEVSEILHNAIRLPFDHAIREYHLGNIVPDVIATKDGRDLLVEFAVTHFCGEEKLAKMEARMVSAIEIDLRPLLRNMDKADLEEAVLFTAPRKWLCNPKRTVARAERAARNEARERENTKNLAAYEKAFQEISIERPDPIEIGNLGPLLVGRLTNSGIKGTGFFTVRPTIWQTAIIAWALANDHQFTSISARHLLKEKGYLRKNFDGVDPSDMERTFNESRAPCSANTAVYDWATTMRRARVLKRFSSEERWHLCPSVIRMTPASLKRRSLPINVEGYRLGEIIEVLETIVPSIRHPGNPSGEFDLGAWMKCKLPNNKYSPGYALRFDDCGFANFMKKLWNISESVRSENCIERPISWGFRLRMLHENTQRSDINRGSTRATTHIA